MRWSFEAKAQRWTTCTITRGATVGSIDCQRNQPLALLPSIAAVAALADGCAMPLN